MARPDMTLSVMGGIHANADSSNRLFEIALCTPGEPVHLLPEPMNKHDPSAVAVYSARGAQTGYLSAERCGWIGAKINLGEDVRAISRRRSREARSFGSAFQAKIRCYPKGNPRSLQRDRPKGVIASIRTKSGRTTDAFATGRHS